MATINLTAPQPYNVSIADFWDARSGAAILQTDTIYRFYTGLYYIQVTGTGLTYSGDDPDPLGTGTYTSIALYADAGFTNQIASYSSLTSIDFANYFSSGPTTALSGNDTIFGQPGANIGMGGGNVALAGYGGDDTMSAGPGSGVSNNISGGDGNDTISGGGVDGGIVWNFLYGGDGNDTIFGGTIFTTGSVENYAYGEGGNDSLTGGNSALNHLYGGDGSDTLVGGGSSATNYLYGEGGDDNITAGNGAIENFLYGGGGNDVPAVAFPSGELTEERISIRGQMANTDPVIRHRRV
jgi:Ca2+-binding RTX toxin-like protein